MIAHLIIFRGDDQLAPGIGIAVFVAIEERDAVREFLSAQINRHQQDQANGEVCFHGLEFYQR
jgi:hypothetical protein